MNIESDITKFEVNIRDYLNKIELEGCLDLFQDFVLFTNKLGNENQIKIYYPEIKSIYEEDKYDNCISVQCKNFRFFRIFSDIKEKLESLKKILSKRIFYYSDLNLPCFNEFSQSITDSASKYYWNIYNIENEFGRMGFTNQQWVKSYINEEYKLCPTYPQILYVPYGTTYNIISGCAKFRSKQRFPVLTYFCEDSQASLCRSAQPLVGLAKVSKEDSFYLKAIADMTNKGFKKNIGQSSDSNKNLVIVDTRPMINAFANKAKGKGFETTRNYPFCKFYFSAIENIHVMRKSLKKLCKALYTEYDTYSSFSMAVDSSGWLKHIQSALETSLFIARTIQSGTSVLVHCSDGWDRTAQTCALASLLLDSFYRSVHGFIILIEKEFLSFGHKFHHRCHHNNTSDKKEVSPIFIQFLDCVYQIMHQYPGAFQFDENFLLFIAENLFNCKFGTFLFDNEQQRLENKVFSDTRSIWSIDMEYFHNPYLDSSFAEKLIIPVTNKNYLKVWTRLYANGFNIYSRNDPRTMILSSIDEIRSCHRVPNDINPFSLNWQHPISNENCPKCKAIYSYQNAHPVHCWTCYSLLCSKCIIRVNQNNICQECNLKVNS